MKSISCSSIQLLKFITTVVEMEAIYHDSSLNRRRMNGCYKYYAAQFPLIGMTEPKATKCPYGIQVIDSYEIGIEKVIEILSTVSNDAFVNIELYWPLTPECKEPCWQIRTTSGNYIAIGANTGTSSITPSAESNMDNDENVVTLYLEDWQKKLIHDFLGVHCDSWEVSVKVAKGVMYGAPTELPVLYSAPIEKYSAPIEKIPVKSKRMYLTNWQMRELRDEAGVICDFIELTKNIVLKYGVSHNTKN
jgi:hypothetical protein